MKPKRDSQFTFSGKNASQIPVEFNAFLQLLRDEGVTSYLEVGARHGDTFHSVMSALPVGSEGMAIDLPAGAWGARGTGEYLQEACLDLANRGYVVHSKLGDSHAKEIQLRVAEFAPYDCILIDADHRYEPVKQDWLDYRKFATKLVAFHDIDGEGVCQRQSQLPVEVPRLWNELKTKYRHVEFIERPRSDRPMGIGVLWIA